MASQAEPPISIRRRSLRNFLSVFDAANASSTATSTLSVSERVQILVSEIKAGSAGSPDDKFIELYNPNDFAVNLSGWSLKRKPDAAATSTVNLVSSFSSSTIPAKGFFLIAHDNYRGETSPDVRYSNSAPLAYRDEGIVLVNERGEIIDEAGYREITAGQSLERKALAGSTAESLIGEDRFAGNGYDSGAETDFVSRETPEPQNAAGLPEPRPAPSVPADFSARYSSSTAEIIFSWTPLAGSFVYRLNEISASSSVIVAETAASETAIPVSAYGRDFLFSLRAFDGEGLGSGRPQRAFPFRSSSSFPRPPTTLFPSEVIPPTAGSTWERDFPERCARSLCVAD